MRTTSLLTVFARTSLIILLVTPSPKVVAVWQDEVGNWICKAEKMSALYFDGKLESGAVDWQYVLDKDGFWPIGLPDDGKEIFALRSCSLQISPSKKVRQIYCEGPNKFGGVLIDIESGRFGQTSMGIIGEDGLEIYIESTTGSCSKLNI